MVLCEFLHAMGNSPGDIEEYFQLMYEYDTFCGGFVWEWCDHAVYMGKTVEGKDQFYYGGDFGEFPHDGNFCMDGLIYPDRTPHTGLLEYKNVARPIRAKLCDDGTFEFYNTFDFINAKDEISIRYSIVKDEQVIESGELNQVDIMPHKCTKVNIHYEIEDNTDSYFMFEYIQKQDNGLISRNHHRGFDQIILSRKAHHFTKACHKAITVSENDTQVYVSGETFKYTFDKLKGVAESIVNKNTAYICKPMEYNIWRATTDNDRKIVVEWNKAGYHRAKVKVYNTEIKEEKGRIDISFDFSLAPIFIQKILTAKSTWSIFSDGSIELTIDAKRDITFPYLPRFGVRAFFPNDFEYVEYKGFGPNESYIDKHRSNYFGKFISTVTDLHEDYIKPQENGSHWGCDSLKISNKTNKIVVKSEEFSFNASHYTQEELTSKNHNYELEESGCTVLCLDSHMSGIGSNSCGQPLLQQYRVEAKELHFHMLFNFEEL